jgi:hypothetical protein
MMGVVTIKNSVTCKTRFIGKQDYSEKIILIDALLNRQLTKLLPANAIVWLQRLYHDRDATLAL